MTTRYTDNEIMALNAGRLIKDGDIVFAGTGLSILAATAAKHVFAPRAVIFFETGGIDPSLQEMPMAVADLRVMSGTSINVGLIDAFCLLTHRRLHTIALLGAAEIDRYGNLNTTSIGDYHRPKTRFPGSGGAADAAALASGFIAFVKHEKRRFVERLDYLTSVGWYQGYDTRKRLGLKRGGPIAVVTNLGVMQFDASSKAMYLAEYYPGVTIERIVENTGFEMDVSRAREAPMPSDDELRLLRTEVDPQGLMCMTRKHHRI
ncbi:MAG TPA: CoA-transferase [Syntrophorhabdaceae bacterium]|nr:CoA-transferase [Syntrophorhabdaceae bacterium]